MDRPDTVALVAAIRRADRRLATAERVALAPLEALAEPRDLDPLARLLEGCADAATLRPHPWWME